jgi:hypothetical protein
MPHRKPDPRDVRKAESQLERCLRILLRLFPDPEFQQTSPRVRLEHYAPLPEQSFRPTGHLVTLYTTKDLGRPVEDVLALLLHRGVHLANAFRWTEDCNGHSRHNRRFRDLAEEVGFEVSWVNSRYGWAQTTPTPGLQRLLADLPLTEEVLEPFHDPLGARRPMCWHCGQFCFPEPEEIRALLRRPAPAPHLMNLLAVHGRTVRYESSRPMLKVTGDWLAHYGFPIGSRVRLQARYGELRIQARDLSLREEDLP